MSTEAVTLKADIRDRAGSNATIALRKQGKLPAVVYGHKQEPVSIAVDEHEFVEGLHHGHRLFSVALGSKNETVLLKDLQYDYLGKDIIHVDLIRVDLSERVTVDVKLDFRGVAKGTLSGGILEESLTELSIECGVTAIPSSIAVVVRDLGIGDSLHARDIQLPAGCTLVTPADALVVICHETKAEAAVEAAAEGVEPGAAEPVVITERKKEESAAE